MIEEQLKVGIYARKFVVEEATGSFTFTNSFLNLPQSFEREYSVCLIFRSKQDIAAYHKAFPECKKQLYSICDYRQSLKSQKLSKLDSFKFRIGSWLKRILNKFFLQVELVHPKIHSDFSESEKISMENLIDHNSVDLVVYPFWFDYPTTDRPFIIFYWDAAHRYLSFMPDIGPRNEMHVERVFIPALQKAFKIIVPNNAAIIELESLYKVGIAGSRYSVIPFSFSQNTNPDSEFELSVLGQLGVPESFLFMPAGFWPHKNHRVLIDAVRILNQRGFRLNVVMTGPDRGNYNYIENLIKKFDLKEQFSYLGFVDREKLLTLYRNASAMVFASIVGPNNYPPIEAASLGCPVILSDLPGHREQMGESALYFDKFSPNDLADQIQLLTENDVLRGELIQKGKKLAKGLDPYKYFEQLETVFDEFKKYRLLWGDHYSLK